MKNRLLNKLGICFSFICLTLAMHHFTYAAPRDTNSTLAQQIYANCHAKAREDLCTTHSFTQVARQFGPDVAIQTLSAYKTIPNAAAGCHFIAHSIAQQAYKQNAHSADSLFADLPIDACTGGFLMGLLEAKRLDGSLTNEKPQAVEALCHTVSKGEISASKTCFHTMGHVFLVDTNGDIDAALTRCQGYSNEQFECFAGVFMEHVFKRNLNVHFHTVLPAFSETYQNEIQHLCAAYADLFAEACWREASHVFMQTTKTNSLQLDSLCSQSGHISARNMCLSHAFSILALSAPQSATPQSLCAVYHSNHDVYQLCRETIANRNEQGEHMTNL